LLPIPMELAPPVSGVVFICIFWTVLFCIIIIVLFILGFALFFIHLAFRTHVSSCVRGEIKHP
jgi:heme/copper-type cytochrome/quinol oxidase subunit 2